MLGALLDRCCFWPLPGWVASYRLTLPHEQIFHSALEVWFIPGQAEGPTVLFCHGNAGNLRFPTARRDRLLALHQAGANVWAFDYRGFGKSAGQPSESGLYEDGRAVYGLVRHRHNPALPLVLYGRSLGGAVATYLATEVWMPSALILESTFTSAPDVCASYLGSALARRMTCQFDSAARIKHLACPLFSVHGTADRVVPYALGKRLFDVCPTASDMLSVFGAGHNNLTRVAGEAYGAALERWLSGSRSHPPGEHRSSSSGGRAPSG